MTYLVDARRLIDAFAESDPRTPMLAFALLSIYLDEGPFEFDAANLAKRLSDIPMKARVNPEELASLQTDLERFFTPTSAGWVPRSGIFDPEPHSESGARHAGSLPGEQQHPG
jgi:hypothetical protein